MSTTTEERYQLLISGERVEASIGDYRMPEDTVTGEPIAQFATATSANVDHAVEVARGGLRELATEMIQ